MRRKPVAGVPISNWPRDLLRSPLDFSRTQADRATTPLMDREMTLGSPVTGDISRSPSDIVGAAVGKNPLRNCVATGERLLIEVTGQRSVQRRNTSPRIAMVGLLGPSDATAGKYSTSRTKGPAATRRLYNRVRPLKRHTIRVYFGGWPRPTRAKSPRLLWRPWGIAPWPRRHDAASTPTRVHRDGTRLYAVSAYERNACEGS